MTTGFSPPPMPDDTLQLSGILDDSGLADDGPWRWLGEDGVKGRTAMSAQRMLIPMVDDLQPRDSVSAADCCSQNSDDVRLLEAQSPLEEARAEAELQEHPLLASELWPMPVMGICRHQREDTLSQVASAGQQQQGLPRV